MRQASSSKTYSIQIEIFVIMLSCMRLSLFLALCFSFSDKCVQYLDSASSYIWLTKLRFIPSITWRPKCPVGVIDKFLAEGTVQGEELYSMHMQFNSLSDYAEGLKFGRVRYLRAMCACRVPKLHWAWWDTTQCVILESDLSDSTQNSANTQSFMLPRKRNLWSWGKGMASFLWNVKEDLLLDSIEKVQTGAEAYYADLLWHWGEQIKHSSMRRWQE